LNASAVLTTLLTYLFYGKDSFLRSYPFLSQSRNSPQFKKPEASLPHSQVPATCPYPEPVRSGPYPHKQLPDRFPTKTLNRLLVSPIRSTCPTYLIFLDLFTRTIFGEQYSSLSSSLCSFHYSPVTSSLLGPNILLSTLFSNTVSLRFSLNVSDQVSHPYKTTDKIIVLYILMFKFLGSKLEDKRFCTD